MLDKVLEERELFATYTQKERRVHVKRYLFEHTCAARPLGFRMAWFDDDNEACVVGFAVRTGLTVNFLYQRMTEVRKGQLDDHPMLGGHRIKGQRGDHTVIPRLSAARMTAEGWFRLKLREAEPMPNSDIVQIDFIEKKELYEEFKADVLVTGSVDSEVPSYVCNN